MLTCLAKAQSQSGLLPPSPWYQIGLLADENDLLGMNLFHLSGNKLDNEFLGSSFHWGAFHLESDGLSRWHCPRKFKGTQSAKSATERKITLHEEPGRHPVPVQILGNPCEAGLHLKGGHLSQL